MGDYLDVIEQFRRLPSVTQHALANRFNLLRPEDEERPAGSLANTWLLRAREAKILDEFGKAVQCA